MITTAQYSHSHKLTKSTVSFNYQLSIISEYTLLWMSFKPFLRAHSAFITVKQSTITSYISPIEVSWRVTQAAARNCHAGLSRELWFTEHGALHWPNASLGHTATELAWGITFRASDIFTAGVINRGVDSEVISRWLYLLWCYFETS